MNHSTSRRSFLQTAGAGAITGNSLLSADALGNQVGSAFVDEGELVKIGVIGLHGHYSHLLRDAREMGDCEVVAVSDKSEPAVEKFRQKEPLAGSAGGYTDWRRLIENTPMDLCIVAGENGDRAEQLIELAGRGVHIISEKPLAITLDDLQRVREALAKTKSRLTMLLTMRHDPKYATIRKLVQEGAVGQVRQVTCQKSYRLGERAEWQKHRKQLGGTIPFIGIHALDLMWWITGLPFAKLAAFHAAGALPQMKETEDSASILVAYHGGATGTARLDYLRPATAPSHGDDRLRIAGTKGVIEIAYPDDEPLLITAKEKPRRIKVEPTEPLLANFFKSLRSDAISRIPAEDCFYMTEVVLRARQAADEQKMIEVPPPIKRTRK